jgi:hypothetical protein
MARTITTLALLFTVLVLCALLMFVGAYSARAADDLQEPQAWRQHVQDNDLPQVEWPVDLQLRALSQELLRLRKRGLQAPDRAANGGAAEQPDAATGQRELTPSADH